MNRNKFLKIALPLLTIPTAGVWFFDHHFSNHNGAKRLLKFKNLDEAMQELNRIEHASKLNIESDWNLYQNLTHCSQSIEFSMSGFPETKPAIFQNTIGDLVFSHFEKQGFMRHNRTEPIPKAPILEKEGDLTKAIERLKMAVVNFDNFQKELLPHFAYGKLSKNEYQNAHCMHLADHFAMMTY
jgi:Protein of unknown function (DUF1569)